MINIYRNKKEGDEILAEKIGLRHWAVDFLYLVLGVFTHFYGAALTLLFFFHAGTEWPIVVSALDAFQEPYLGGLGVYVVLKEIRKRYHKHQSKHYGEYFVAAWALLLFISSVFILVFPNYGFDTIYKLILTNGLATLVIYLGSLINRP